MADQVADDHHACRDADAHGQSRLAVLKLTNPFNEGQSSQQGPLSVVLVRVWIPEISQNPITHILGNKAAKPFHFLRSGGVIDVDQLAQVFRIKLRRKSCGTD